MSENKLKLNQEKKSINEACESNRKLKQETQCEMRRLKVQMDDLKRKVGQDSEKRSRLEEMEKESESRLVELMSCRESLEKCLKESENRKVILQQSLDRQLNALQRRAGTWNLEHFLVWFRFVLNRPSRFFSLLFCFLLFFFCSFLFNEKDHFVFRIWTNNHSTKDMYQGVQFTIWHDRYQKRHEKYKKCESHSKFD